MNTKRTIGKLVLLGSILCAPLLAQSPTGAVQGTVTDVTGAVIPNAHVTITNTGTNQTKTIDTDGAGRFQAPLLPPGNYNVQVTATGFRPDRQDNVTVEVSESHPVNFSLAVGGQNESVVVTATSANLETSTSATGAVITEKRIVDLPLNGRNPFDLATLTPGVSNVGGASTPHISGSRNANNEQQPRRPDQHPARKQRWQQFQRLPAHCGFGAGVQCPDQCAAGRVWPLLRRRDQPHHQVGHQ